MSQISLFSEPHLTDLKDKKKRKIENRIESIPLDQLESETKVQELKEELLFDEIKLKDYNRREGSEARQGKNLVIEVPYEGRQDVLEKRPSTWSSPPKCQKLSMSHIVLHIEVTPSSDPDEIEDEIERRIKEIEDYVENANEDIRDFNDEIEKKIKGKIQSRVEKLKKTDDKMDQLLD